MTLTDAAHSHPPHRPSTERDFVFTFSYESFADAAKRGMMRPPDRLVSTLMTLPEVRRLVVADPYRSWTTDWLRQLIDREHTPRSTEKIRFARPLRRAREDPVALDAIEAAYLSYEHAVRRTAQRARLDRPAVITMNPLFAGFGRFDWTGPAVYYGRDDWLSSPARMKYWPAYREAYRRISRSGLAVAAVSEEIMDRIAPTGPHRVVPNGIAPDEWTSTQPEPPEWFAALTGPRAVYVGTLDTRLDVEGLITLARARPELQIVLVGPAPSAADIAPLQASSNIHVRGLIGRAEVVAVLRNAELTLLAHRRTRLTEAMSPLKVYEYLAAGRPVLATDLRPVRDFGERVLLADTVSDFVDLLDAALALGVAPEAERLRFIDENAWITRHHDILALAAE